MQQRFLRHEADACDRRKAKLHESSQATARARSSTIERAVDADNECATVTQQATACTGGALTASR